MTDEESYHEFSFLGILAFNILEQFRINYEESIISV
jgi:hypothetical protein